MPKGNSTRILLLFDVLFFLTAWAHVLLAPFTKVEESFNLHATHDVLMYGVGTSQLQKYDHNEFPGVVPRTFIGSLILGWMLYPLARGAEALGLLSTKLGLQILGRLILATANSVGLCALRRSVSRRFGATAGALFVILSCTQFHVPFWLGRTLPNMFALLPINLAFSFLLDRSSDYRSQNRRYLSAVALITSTAVIFRSELVLLLPGVLLQGLFLRRVPFLSIVSTGLIAGLSSIALTTLVDSYFWQKFPLWPELAGVYFNVFEGKSQDWGVSPVHAYFSEHLPKLLLSSLPLSVLACVIDYRAVNILLPWLAYVGLISFLGHKEWRFIVYSVPVFNVAAARGAQLLLAPRVRGFKRTISRLILLSLIGLNIGATVFFTYISRLNYPGGHALVAVHQIAETYPSANVYIDDLAAQTGASLFTQLNGDPFGVLEPHIPPWRYNKTEKVQDYNQFTHVVTEEPERFQVGWQNVGSVRSLSRVIMPKPRSVRGWRDLLPTAVVEDRLWIMQRDLPELGG